MIQIDFDLAQQPEEREGGSRGLDWSKVERGIAPDNATGKRAVATTRMVQSWGYTPGPDKHVTLPELVLVGYQIENRMIETVAPHLPELDPAMLKDLKTRLSALPPFRSQATMLRADEQTWLKTGVCVASSSSVR